jgi:hypothetical protein
MRTMQVEVWVMVDANEDYAVGTSAEEMVDSFDTNVGTDPEVATRRVKVVLTVPVPEVPVLTGEVPAEGDAELSVG